MPRADLPKPKPINARPNDSPVVCLQVNEEWLIWIVGIVLEHKYPEFWGGTLDENRQAREDTQALAFLLQEAFDCAMTECCTEVFTIWRQNPTTGQQEVSQDNGQTWKPKPNQLSTTIPMLPPPVPAGVSASKCDAATNGKQHLEDWIAKVSDSFTTYGTFFEWAAAVVGALAAIVLSLLGLAPLAVGELEAIGAVIAALKAAWELGKTVWDEFWTSDERDKILCALYCNIGDDGSFTEAQYQNMLTQLYNQLGNNVESRMMIGMLQSIGVQGVNNLCGYGASADADCSACGCGCDDQTWSIWSGAGSSLTEGDDSNGHYYMLTAVQDDRFGGGFYAAVLTTNEPTGCCILKDSVVVSGTPDTNAWVYQLCGQAIPASNQGFNNVGLAPNGDTKINSVGWSNRFPFVIKLYFKAIVA